ncbi:uncharacterized protein BDV17DRAFT_267229 [Aspergillus undulatus]|uniref:uncharacterized protein n=1 Tax=Aspergillus undulatus TaxID=1810928 RepID=UPI003CCD5C8F
MTPLPERDRDRDRYRYHDCAVLVAFIISHVSSWVSSVLRRPLVHAMPFHVNRYHWKKEETKTFLCRDLFMLEPFFGGLLFCFVDKRKLCCVEVCVQIIHDCFFLFSVF